MNTHLTEEEIAICAEALDNGSYQSLSHDIREHVAQCDECAEEILMVADIAHSEQLKITPETPKKDTTQKIIAWSVSVAAAIALVLLLFDLSDHAAKKDGELLTQGNNSDQEFDSQKLNTATDQTEDNKETNSTSEEINNSENALISDNHQQVKDDSKDSNRNQPLPSSGAPGAPVPSSGVPPHLREKADTIRFLAHFEPNKDLEKLVERYEGNLRTSEEVDVSTPITITSSNSSITIKWENPNRKRLIIEVFNNEGNRIMETETTHEEYTLQNLNDGLYYWKLISENFELLFCGKIVIKAN